ncbi:MAG: lytic murein transglycosylase B [Gallionella sp.]|nr:lytic murein transglycosylase B [Gallionella sp.]
MKKRTYLFSACVGLFSLSAHAANLPGIPAFIDEMVSKHQFNRAELTAVFDAAQHKPSIIDAITLPATKKPWGEYRAVFVNPQRVQAGLVFWQTHRAIFQRAEQQYGVPQSVILAIIGVETSYGKNMGKYRVVDALTTLAFDYPKRAPFFRSELENFLLLAREQRFDYLEPLGSYAGAIGIPQFMPSSYRKHAVDFNSNRVTDLRNEPEDAIGSVANYLQQYGWQANEAIALPAQISANFIPKDDPKAIQNMVNWASQGVRSSEPVAFDRTARLMTFTLADHQEYWLGFKNFDVITRYNNSDFYAMSVFQLASALESAANNRQ